MDLAVVVAVVDLEAAFGGVELTVAKINGLDQPTLLVFVFFFTKHSADYMRFADIDFAGLTVEMQV
jgi:hypothetical protein